MRYLMEGICMKVYLKKDIDSLSNEYYSFLEGKVGQTSKEYYSCIINEYLNDFIFNYVEFENYNEMFNKNRIIKFVRYRKSNIVQAALSKFLLYLKEDRRCIDYTQYHSYKDNVDEVFKEKPKKDKEIKFLSKKEIESLFLNDLEYRPNEREITRAIFAVSFFCGFEQKHLMELRLSDYISEERLLRNIRRNEHSLHYAQWIELNDLTVNALEDYLQVRKKINTRLDNFFIFNGNKLNNTVINSLRTSTGLVNNKDYFNKEINIQILIRSMMLYSLKATEGMYIYDLLRLSDNTKQLDYAWTKYCQDKYMTSRESKVCSLSLTEILKGFDTNDNDEVFIRKIEEDEQLDIHDISIDEEFDLEYIKIDEELLNCSKIEYKEEYDVTMEDIDNCDQGTELKRESKVTIQRLVRNSQLANKIKELYENRCQLCGYKLRSANGGYKSEAHHIRPFNKVHRGDDTSKNLIVLCPNCHTQFDELYYAINPDTLEIQSLFEDDDYENANLDFVEGHELGREYLEYTWKIFHDKKEQLKNQALLNA